MSVPVPVVFIHGLWLHSSSWKAWVDLFAAEGYLPTAPGWPREHSSVFKCRQRGEDVVGMGIAEIAAHYVGVVEAMDQKPVVIGHSHGGLIAEYLLARDLAVGAVAIDPSRAAGELPQPISQLVDEFPAIGNPANRGREVNLNNRQFRAVYGNGITEDESDGLYERWTIPASGALLFETDFADSTPPAPTTEAGGPLLFVGGTAGQPVADNDAKSSFERYRASDATTDRTQFPDRGHSLAIDSEWQDVAKSVLGWLRERGI